MVEKESFGFKKSTIFLFSQQKQTQNLRPRSCSKKSLKTSAFGFAELQLVFFSLEKLDRLRVTEVWWDSENRADWTCKNLTVANGSRTILIFLAMQGFVHKRRNKFCATPLTDFDLFIKAACFRISFFRLYLWNKALKPLITTPIATAKDQQQTTRPVNFLRRWKKFTESRCLLECEITIKCHLGFCSSPLCCLILRSTI